jgi:hypothetical protein
MDATAISILVALLTAATASTVWVFHDARRRGLPARKAATWAGLQWIEWPLFLWLYRRIRPRSTA